MKTLPLIMLSAALLLIGCQQTASTIITELPFSRPVGADPGGSLAAPQGAQRTALLARVPDAAFDRYAEDGELRELLHKLDALAGEVPASAKLSARELAKANSVRGEGPAQFFSEEEALAQEEQYLALTPHERTALATQAMRALLASPARKDDTFPEFRLHSFDALDVELLRGALGGYMGRTLIAERDYHDKGKTSEAQWMSRRNSALAYKRVVARLMLEDVAANRDLPAGTRCAALKCLQHIYTEQACHGDGGHDLDYLTSALPRHGAIPVLLSLGDMRFCHGGIRWEDEQRFDAFMAKQKRADSFSAEELAKQSSIAFQPPVKDEASSLLILHSSLSAYVPAEDLLRAEQRYKQLDKKQRRALAKAVLFKHLTQPLTPCHSEMYGKSLPLRSFDALDIETERKAAGGIFAEDNPSAAQLFKRMVVRLLAEEDLAEHSVLSSEVHRAALTSLQDIWREVAGSADGHYPLLYLIDALPGMHLELQTALLGGNPWEDDADSAED